jgi:hypothetical protein
MTLSRRFALISTLLHDLFYFALLLCVIFLMRMVPQTSVLIPDVKFLLALVCAELICATSCHETPYCFFRIRKARILFKIPR